MPCLLYKALIEEPPLLPPFMMAVVMEMMAGQSAMNRRGPSAKAGSGHGPYKRPPLLFRLIKASARAPITMLWPC
jgi:hypothetical protein